MNYEPDLSAEALLRELHQMVVEGEQARLRRNELMDQMCANGYPQYVLAYVLNDAAQATGGPAVTDGMVQKIISRRRSK